MGGMNEVTAPSDLPPSDLETEAKVKDLCHLLETKFPQADVKTEQFLHAGMYVRTCSHPKGSLLVGAKIKIPTVLIIDGDVSIKSGGKWMRIQGHAVLRGAPGRRVIVLTHEDTVATMLFPTDAKTVEEAEEQFTDEFNELYTRKHQWPDSLPQQS